MNLTPGLIGLYWLAFAIVATAAFSACATLAKRTAAAIANAACPCCGDQQ